MIQHKVKYIPNRGLYRLTIWTQKASAGARFYPKMPGSHEINARKAEFRRELEAMKVYCK